MKLTQEEISQAILLTLRWILGTAVVGAFGIGWFMADLSSDMDSMKGAMIELKENIPPKWVADSISDLETEQARLWAQLDQLKEKVNGNN